MKKIFHFVLFFLLALALPAQDCQDAYAYFKEGATLEYASYDKKGKLSATMRYRNRKITTENDTTYAWIEYRSFDARDRESVAGEFVSKCSQGALYVDMRALIPGQAAQGQSSMEMEIEGAELVFPPDMKVGMVLPDGEMVMRSSVNGLSLMNMRFVISNRRVEAEEEVTTPAGTFTCLKVGYDFEFNFMGTRQYRTYQWFARNIGQVKTETYDSKGRLDGSMELTRME